MITFEVMYYTTIMKTKLVMYIFILQPLVVNSNISYIVVLENSCTHTTSAVGLEVVNGLVTYTVQYPQNWTNISIVAENNCKSAILAVNISSTDMFCMLFMLLNLTSVMQ